MMTGKDMKREAVLAYFKVLSHRSLEEPEVNHRTLVRTTDEPAETGNEHLRNTSV
jgi:hypothetical protein